MPLDIVTIEHSPHFEVLQQTASIVQFPLSTEDKQIIEDMKAMVLKLNALGIAAPQIGVAKQIIVYGISLEAKDIRSDAHEVVPLTVLLNPSYEPTFDAKTVYDWEGCLSVAEKSGKVPRYDKITYSAKTPDGQLIKENAQGFTARVLQHEIDHIQGILITDRLTPDCIQGHPKDMLSLRFNELNTKQKELMKKMISQIENDFESVDPARAKMFGEAKKLIEGNKND